MRAFIAIVQLALNMMTTRLGKTFCMMLILTGGFVLCGISLLSMNIADYESIQLKQICDSSRTGFLSNDNAEEFLLDENATYEERVEALTKKQPHHQFYNRLKESGIVELCGQVSELSNPEVDKNIPRIQAEHSMDTSDQRGCTFSYVQKDILALYDVDIEKKVDETDWMVGGIFLGWGFKEEYGNAEFLDFKGEQRKILGFIKPNQKFLVEDVAYPDGVSLSGLHDLDYTVMYLEEEDRYSTNTIHFRLAKGVSRDEFVKKVEEISKETDSEIIKLQFVDEYLEELKRDNIDMLGSIISYAKLVLGIILVLTILGKTLSITLNKRMYGVFYSSGLTTNQINSIFLIDNIVTIFLPFIVACFTLYYGAYTFCDNFASYPGMILEMVRSVLLSRVIIQELFICVGMVVIATVIPAAIFSRVSPLTMMRDFYE